MEDFNAVYCPSCKKEIPSAASLCFHCGAPASVEERKKHAILAEKERLEEESARMEAEELRKNSSGEIRIIEDGVIVGREIAPIIPEEYLPETTGQTLPHVPEKSALDNSSQPLGNAPQLSEHDAKVYNRATGRGICPNCKSPNVKTYSYKEGGSSAGANAACCLGCVFSPLAFLALPFMAGKKITAFECQYCSNRWRL